MPKPLHPDHQAATTDQAKAALHKSLLNGASNSRADAARAKLTSDELVGVVAVSSADAMVSQLPKKDRSPAHISADHQSELLGSVLRQFEQF